MAPRISLALAIHNHQPVGNFGWVIAEVFERAYEPMVDALERHPGVRIALHYTGPLLEWLRSERPEFIDRLRVLVDRGQVEIMGGGYYEPVLASLPERDRIGQLRRMADELDALFGRRPSGAWLAERVWEPDVPTSLAGAGYRWTVLDDAHFRAAAIPEEALWGPYTTEDQGRILTIFGTEQGLRYRIPFHEVDEVIAYLRDHATESGDRVGMMGDDGEKFGAWPTTYEHCWAERRWVDRFLTALDTNRDWLTTVTPSAWLADHPPIGRVYIPTGSYAEMGEWALPADEGQAFGAALHRAQERKRPEARWLRGAFWRNFQVKYREINDLHKQMLRVSDKVAGLAGGPDRARATDHLYQAQSNDCYWHDLFGGIYIGHMRLATHEHLIAAEDIADAAAPRDAAARSGVLRDLDMDGVDEVLLATDGQVVSLKPNAGAGIGDWDVRAVRHALGAVMRRRPEAYHETLREHERRAAGEPLPDRGGPNGGGPDGEGPNGGIASIHDLVATKEAGLSARIHYDHFERRSGLVRLLPPGAGHEEYEDATVVELGDFVDGPFDLIALAPDSVTLARDGSLACEDRPRDVRVEKTVTVGGGRHDPSLTLRVAVTNESPTPVAARLGLEWNLMLLGGGGNPDAWWEIDGQRSTHDAARAASGVTALSSGNAYVGIDLSTAVEPPADAWIAPIETVSNSEAGFERVYQGSCLLLSWPISLAPGEHFVARVAQHVTCARDREAEETAAG